MRNVGPAVTVQTSGNFSGLRGESNDAIQGDSYYDHAAGPYGLGRGVRGFGVLGQSTGTSGIGVRGVASTGAGVRGEAAGPASNTSSGVVGVAAYCEFGNNSSVGVGGSGRGAGARIGNKTGVLGITDGGVWVQGGTKRRGRHPRLQQLRRGAGLERQRDRRGRQERLRVRRVRRLDERHRHLRRIRLEHGRLCQGGASGRTTSTAQASDGTTRTLYSQDSAEPLVEDVGEAKLVNGLADVKLDPDFAAVADGGTYHVFLTEGGDYGGLYVPKKDHAGFEVRARNAAAGGPFSYRVAAKRKGATGKRLEKLDRPTGLSEGAGAAEAARGTACTGEAPDGD